MSQTQPLHLSIGQVVPEKRLSGVSHSGAVSILGKAVRFNVTESAMRAISELAYPVLVELELYFSCLIRKQVRFSQVQSKEQLNSDYMCVVPGLYTCFRAVTTRECRRDEVEGRPPVATMPIREPHRFVPDWVKIDYRARQWLGEYGFTRNL